MTTQADLLQTLEALERVTGVEPGRLGLQTQNGRTAVVLDGGRQDVSPWLPRGELREWMWGAIRGARLLREEGRR